MEIVVNKKEVVEVNPKDVIQKLIENEIGRYGWVFEENDKYYLSEEKSMGNHSMDVVTVISREKYEYVNALNLILKRL